MANNMAKATRYTSELDKLFVQKAVTGFFADNVLRAKFVGAKTVMVPDVEMSGLADYDRANGFTTGSITVAHTPLTMSMDRARSFQIDREDMDETGVDGLSGQVMGEFVRTRVVPEADAYVLSKLAAIATTANQTVALGAAESIATHAYKLFNELVNKVQDAAGYDEELVAFVNPTAYSSLMSTPELSRLINVGDFKKGEITTKVKSINGVSILPVSSACMKTAYEFKDGSTAGETDGGFAPTDAAQEIGMLVLPKKAARLVKKTETIRAFSPEQNQSADAYKYDYRLYYDLFVTKNKKGTIFAYTYSA